MTERIIDLAEEPARLSVRTSCLVIACGEEGEVTDRQFGKMEVFHSRKRRRPEEKPEQLLLF